MAQPTLHQLAASFILGYHGCDKPVGERILKGTPFKQSNNDYDWLGPGIYFWEANPLRGLDFAREAKKRRTLDIKNPFVIGAVISLGLCLDLTTAAGIEQVRAAHKSLAEIAVAAGRTLPKNAPDGLLRRLDCVVIQMFHTIRSYHDDQPIDSVKASSSKACRYTRVRVSTKRLTSRSRSGTPIALRACSASLQSSFVPSSHNKAGTTVFGGRGFKSFPRNHQNQWP